MFRFKGGAHPPEHKDTSGLAIETVPLPKKVVLPLSQHIGKPAKAVVKARDPVKTGQRIAEADGAVSANIHASISGKILSIDSFAHPSGMNLEAITIESDGLDERAENIGADIGSLDAAGILERIRQAGIVGMGGAAFPTHVKLAPPKDKKIDTLILNGCECEPYLTCDHRVMLENTSEVVSGARLMLKALGVGSGIIAVEENKSDAAARIEQELKGDGSLRVMCLKTKYPQGAEKQLIKSCVGREVSSGKLPMDVGCVVQNVQTAKAVHDAVVLGRPLYERVLTVTGAIHSPKNLRGRTGTLVSEIVALCGGLRDDVKKVINGGPMMGTSLFTLDVPIVKGMSGIVALTAAEVKANEPTPCIRCGKCIEVCAMGLPSTTITRYVESRGAAAAGELLECNVTDCIECGTCAYVCPARIPLLQNLRVAKQIVRPKKP